MPRSAFTLVVAAGLVTAAWSPGGDLLVSEPGQGAVVELRPGPRAAARSRTLLSGLASPQGLAFARLDGRSFLYVGESDQIARYPWTAPRCRRSRSGSRRIAHRSA